jgi:hypothetical protein
MFVSDKGAKINYDVYDLVDDIINNDLQGIESVANIRILFSLPRLF